MLPLWLAYWNRWWIHVIYVAPLTRKITSLPQHQWIMLWDRSKMATTKCKPCTWFFGIWYKSHSWMCIMTSWHGNFYPIICPLWGEYTSHHWIPLTEGQLCRASVLLLKKVSFYISNFKQIISNPWCFAGWTLSVDLYLFDAIYLMTPQKLTD